MGDLSRLRAVGGEGGHDLGSVGRLSSIGVGNSTGDKRSRDDGGTHVSCWLGGLSIRILDGIKKVRWKD